VYDRGTGGIVSENQRTLVNECNIYEWIDYWQADNHQWESDAFEMNRETRIELAWASQSVSHMLATLRDIADMTSEKQNVYDAARVAKNALQEYGLGIESKTVSQAYSAPEEDKPLMPPWVQ
jgi:hypothetical protein